MTPEDYSTLPISPEDVRIFIEKYYTVHSSFKDLLLENNDVKKLIEEDAFNFLVKKELKYDSKSNEINFDNWNELLNKIESIKESKIDLNIYLATMISILSNYAFFITDKFLDRIIRKSIDIPEIDDEYFAASITGLAMVLGISRQEFFDLIKDQKIDVIMEGRFVKIKNEDIFNLSLKLKAVPKKYDLLQELVEDHGINMLLSTEQAGEILNYTRQHVVKLIKDGKIQAKKQGRYLKIPISEIIDFINERNRREKVEKDLIN